MKYCGLILVFPFISCGPQAATVKVSSAVEENQEGALKSSLKNAQTSSQDFLSSSNELSSSLESAFSSIDVKTSSSVLASVSSSASSLEGSHSSVASLKSGLKFAAQKENSLEVLLLEGDSWKTFLVEKGKYEADEKTPSYEMILKSSDYVLWNSADFDGDGSYEWIFLPQKETGTMIVWNVEEKNEKYIVEKAWKIVLPEPEKVSFLGVAHLSLSSQSLLLYHTGLKKMEEGTMVASSFLLDKGTMKESMFFKGEKGDSYLFKENLPLMLLENEQKGEKVLQWVMGKEGSRLVVQPFGKLLEDKNINKSYLMNELKGYYLSGDVLYPKGMVRNTQNGLLDGSECQDKKCVWKKYKTEWNAQGRVHEWIELEKREYPTDVKSMINISF